MTLDDEWGVWRLCEEAMDDVRPEDGRNAAVHQKLRAAIIDLSAL
jgi:hypothetical protein